MYTYNTIKSQRIIKQSELYYYCNDRFIFQFLWNMKTKKAGNEGGNVEKHSLYNFYYLNYLQEYIHTLLI